jgi:hypothetical protein
MENGEQKIFVWCDFSEQMSDAIIHGLQIALMLRKELCLISVPGSQNCDERGAMEARLKIVAGNISSRVSNLKIHCMVSEKPLKNILTELAEVYDALLLTAPKTSASSLLKILPESGFPFLFVSGNTKVEDFYQKIVVPVGYMRRCKDLALWASYLGRNNNATIDLMASNEQGQADSTSVKNNLRSIKRLYSNFSFQYNIIDSNTPTWKLAKAAFNHVSGHEHSMLMLAANHRPNFIDNLLGLSEKKIIENSGRIPVMCINSKRDLYTLCG